MKKTLEFSRHGEVLRRALRSGGVRTSMMVTEWDACGVGKLKCSRPIPRTITFRHRPLGLPIWQDVAKSIQGRMDLDLEVRCRRCPECLKARAAHWRLRMLAEIARSRRTWFATYTFRLELQYCATCEATVGVKGGSPPFGELPPDEQFAARHKHLQPYFTHYFKRIRKAGYRLRYCLVAEAHKSGLPHYHALIHEGDDPVPHRVLSGEWTSGFSVIKLVDTATPKAAAYCAKYLSKSVLARVRASQRYGEVTNGEFPPEGIVTSDVRGYDPKRENLFGLT